jgi:hypothetical protein
MVLSFVEEILFLLRLFTYARTAQIRKAIPPVKRSLRKSRLGLVAAPLCWTAVKLTICTYIETEFTNHHYIWNDKKKQVKAGGT